MIWGVALTLGLPLCATAASFPSSADPVGFFTNLASRLLKAEMNLDLNRLQIYPTNQYTPAVHRLLQVAANIYEATTNRFNDDYPHLPTVFRPRFTNDGGTVCICGYAEETNSAFLGSPLKDLFAAASASQIQPDDLVLGIPVVIGVKKGLLNFNEFSMETVAQITRKLELVKSAPGGSSTIYQTNQMFVIGISNVFGAEFWNSYTSNYPRPVRLAVTNYCWLSLTNDYGFMHSSNLVAGAEWLTNDWVGWNPRRFTPPATGPWSFLVPLRSNLIILPDSAYRFATTNFSPLTTVFEEPSGYGFPRWGLTITNRILAKVIDESSDRVVDVVLFSGMVSHQELSLSIAQPVTNVGFSGAWATNDLGGLLADLPGIIQQIQISKGEAESNGNWEDYAISQPSGATRNQAIANFLAFFEPSHVYVYQPPGGGTFYGTHTGLVAVTPFTPTSKRSVKMVWQANDPLVHSVSSELFDATQSASAAWIPPSSNQDIVENLARLNRRYQPWGGSPQYPPAPNDTNAFNPGLRDSSVSRSDHWNFPSGQPFGLPMLGKIHRGTPWQTLYLKSPDLSDLVWLEWIGSTNLSEALLTKPKTDWRLMTLLAALLNTNSPRDLHSVNSSDTGAWLAVLHGISVLTNVVSDEELSFGFSPRFDPLVMSSNSAQAALIESAIRTARTTEPNQIFRDTSGLLAVPELSIQSPWLHHSAVQDQMGISDEAYERIPAQLLSRVRADSLAEIRPDPAGWRLRFTGLDGFSYAVERSTNLVDWLPVVTNQPTNGVFDMVFPGIAESGFYRSVALP